MTNNKMSLENVLDAFMTEEPMPRYEALRRWQDQYPEYRRELADFYMTWLVQSVQAAFPDQAVIDENQLAARMVNYVMNIARRPDAPVQRAAIGTMTVFDEIVLTAVYLLRGQGDDMAITDNVTAMQGEEANLGAIFASLSRLQRNGFISPWNSDPKTEPDGTSKRYFTVMLAGERALAEARVTSRVVAHALGEFA
jgi:hypothetical protein